MASINKKGDGAFVLPGLLKEIAVSVPAKKNSQGCTPFTKEETVQEQAGHAEAEGASAVKQVRGCGQAGEMVKDNAGDTKAAPLDDD